ncbi:MAG: 4'-phosphopantetheinyl transferase family protein [Nocardioides sp.]
MSGSASEERSVTVAWAFGTEPELAGRLIRETIGPGDPTSHDLRLGHRCPSCGSDEHGRPLLTVGSGNARGPFISISRARRLTVVAISRLGPVGVDVEVDGAADFAGFDRVARHPGEQSTDGHTVLWVRKESVLKATGHGLRVEPSRLRVTAPSEPPALVEWNGPGAPPTAWLYDVRTAPGHVAAVTVLAAHRPALVVKEARGAPATTTTP